MEQKFDRRDFLARGGAIATAMTTLAGCTSGTAGNAGNTPMGSSTISATTTGGSGRTTHTPTTITASPENGKLKFINNTDYAVCSLEIEGISSGYTIELLDLANTHDIIKPHSMHTFVASDYAAIDSQAIYKVTATTCEGNKSRDIDDFQFDRGAVWSVNTW